MQHWSVRRPWSTIVQTFVFSLLVFFFAQIFTSDLMTGAYYSVAIGLFMALYNDYGRPYWQAFTQNKFNQAVFDQTDNLSPVNDASEPYCQATEQAEERDSKTVKRTEYKPVKLLTAIDLKDFDEHVSKSDNRFDRLRKYRIKYRYMISVAMFVLMIANSVANYLELPESEQFWEHVFPVFGIIFTFLVLLEYNISLIKREPSPGVFFRENGEHTRSTSASLVGEQKIFYSLKGNVLGIGTGIVGRPILGIIVCWLWLIAVGSWTVFFCYIAVTLYLTRRWRLQLENADGPYTLLELRVFESQSYGDFLELLEGWRYIGVQYRLDGPDTTAMSFKNRFKAVTGNVSDLVIKSQDELHKALAGFSNKVEKFERFDVNTMQCNDSTWVEALEQSIKKCDIVVMLLTDFNDRQKGCLTELNILTNTVAFSKTVLIVNSTTDMQYLSWVLEESWNTRSVSSPNQTAGKHPYILDIDALLVHQTHRRNKMVDIKLQLVDFLYAKAKDQDV